MKNHTKVYFKSLGFTGYEYIPCEICSKRAVDIHHIDCRGMGGSKEKDKIENLMALCRECHIKYGDVKHQKDYLQELHNEYLNGKI